jgi:hypothetical protein
MMVKWLTTMILFFGVAANVTAGIPVFSGNQDGMSAMACCKKKTRDCAGAKTVGAAQLCCLVNCGNPAPTAPNASANFSASAIVVTDSILNQIASLLKAERPTYTVLPLFEREAVAKNSKPKYIQHHSFLI